MAGPRRHGPEGGAAAKRRRAALVVQRYGIDVNGGAEQLCRMVAERMQVHWDVEVLTSCAREYVERFENDYPPGIEIVNGVRVRRFPIDYRRSEAAVFSALDRRVLHRHADRADEELWLKEIGPYCSALIQHVADCHNDYDLFVFVTYLYATTTLVLPMVRDKAILVPNAHDEPPIHARFFDDFFALPRMLMLNTEQEAEFISRRSRARLPPWQVAGVGFDAPKVDRRLFQESYGPGSYFIYAGRIQREKGCEQLFADYLALPRAFREKFRLVLLGKAAMPIPQDDTIVHLGFVSEEMKNSAIGGATAFVMPSRYESYSIALMEAWLCGTPVVVNGDSAVLAAHCQRSGGGLAYRGPREFAEALRWMADPANSQRIDAMRHNGRAYVKNTASWPVVEAKYLQAMEQVAALPPRKRVAFVVQRCGREVNGGAEALALNLAQRMAAYWNTEVLTTCALDYVSWRNHYPAGVEPIGATLVRRFPVAEERDMTHFDLLSADVHARRHEASLEDQEAWMRAQGPWSPDLFDYIATHEADYDVFVFLPYLYATTWVPLPGVAHKAVLVPCAHEEWAIDLNMWDRFFRLPAAIVFNTPEERDFLRRRLPGASLDGVLAGIGIERPAWIDPTAFRRLYGIDDDFLLYVGRIDPSKGCDELFELFMRHRREGGEPRKLVLIGKPVMKIPEHPDIVSLGFVPEHLKWDALAACAALVMPSRNESLSIALLEAWAVGKPALVSGHCEVLVGQCRRANGGLWYRNYEEFRECIALIRRGRNAGILGRQGWRYVQSAYGWPGVERAYLEAVAVIGQSGLARDGNDLERAQRQA